jgi:hypothetical protein
MKMKRIGLVLLGLVVSAVFVPLIGFLASIFVSNIRGDVEVPLFFMFVIIPIAFFIGSSVTGYFIYYEVENRWAFLLVAPAFYCDLLCVLVFLSNVFVGYNTQNPLFWRGLWVSLATGLWWYIISLAGVELGYNIRERFAE